MLVGRLGKQLQPCGWCRVSTAGNVPPEALAEFEARCAAITDPDARRQAARDRATRLGAVQLPATDRRAERAACKGAGLPVGEFDELCPRNPRRLRAVADEDTEGPGEPERLVNVSFRDPYRYSLGTGQWSRGVYELPGEVWQFRARLPHVLARIVRRDGSRRRVDTEYLIAADPDGTRVIVSDEDLRDGRWARKLGVNLSGDTYIIAAVATAIRDTAYRDSPEREATPRPGASSETGHLDVPVMECLPPGYLQLPPTVTAEQAREGMRELVGILAGRPRMALVMGASVGAPFVGPLRRQSHWWDLFGPSQQGKTTTQAVAAAVWGDPRIGEGIVAGWNTTGPGLGRHLGQLGILPPFFDERKVSKFTQAEWGEIIYSTCQGASKLKSEAHSAQGTHKSSPWFGVLFSTGNHRLTDSISAGAFAGIPARVVELTTPFTTDEAEAKRINALLARCYGWLGPVILGTHTVAMVSEAISRAEQVIGSPEGGGVPGTIAQHLHLAVAGAMMADAELGTGSALADAAITAAREYLEVHGHEPEQDADRMLDALAESLTSRRSAWPGEVEFVELEKARTEFIPGQPSEARPVLAQHGYDHESSGIRSSDGQWLYVFTRAWRQLVEEVGVDSTVALAELYRRDALHVPTSSRNKGEWTAQPRVNGKKMPRIYQISLSAMERDGQENEHDGGDPSGTDLSKTREPGLPAVPSVDTPADELAPDRCARCGQPLYLQRPGRELCGRCYGADTEQGSDDAAGPCETCTTPGAFCGVGGVAETALPCVVCGVPTPVRSRCGAPRTGICHGPGVAGERPTAPAEGDDPGRTAPGPRGASRVTKARAAAREATAEASTAALAAGEPLRLLRALETSHAPMRRVDGRMRKPYLRPEVPGITYATHIVAGYSWSRPYSGSVAVLDRSGAWPAAASSVVVAHGGLEHTGELEFSGRPGYYQVQRHPWLEVESMPDPLGNARGETVWVPGPTVALLCELAEENRWADVTVLDSYTADGARLSKWADYVKALRTEAITTYGRSSDQYADVKESFSRAVSMMQGQPLESWKCAVQRPDWAHTIKTQASATLWRWADACRKVAPEYPPISVRNVDELVIPEPALGIVTTVKAPGRASPVRLDPEGIKLGTFKVKSSEEWKGSQT